MKIVCPNCDAAYEVPEAMLVPGRPVRCARCGRDWAPLAASFVAVPPAADAPGGAEAPAAEPAVEPPAVEPLEPVVQPRPLRVEPPPSLVPAARPPVAPAPRAAPPARGAVLAGWVASAFVLIGLVWAAYAWRAEVMRAWPPSTRLYAALGLAGR